MYSIAAPPDTQQLKKSSTRGTTKSPYPEEKSNKRTLDQDKLYLYINTTLTTKIPLHITEVGQTVQKNLEEALNDRIANKCIEEGYIRPNSIRIHTFSAGTVRQEYVDFHVIFQCQVSCPVEGQILECTVKTMTKAGIHAQCIDNYGNVPITVFVARDHHQQSQEFQHIQDGDQIRISVIGARYELNDPYICVIAKLLNNN